MSEYTEDRPIEQLIEEYKSGKTEVFEVIYNKYKNMIVSLAHRLYLVGGDTEDLIQEGFIGLVNAINTFNGTVEFSTYAYVCVKNSMLTAIKRAGSLRNRPLNEHLPIDNSVEKLLYLYTDPEAEIIGQENATELMNKISTALSNYEITVLKLYIDGLSYLEISKKLNKEAKSIDNALQRIKRKIANILE